MKESLDNTVYSPEPTSTNNNSAPSKQEGNSSQEVPTITTPKGGGAISGIGEKFQANPVTGTSSFSVPVAMSPGRSGFTPALSLSYDSGNGNGIFGMGWNIETPSIVRKTSKGLPTYRDNTDEDTFILAGSEDLVPRLSNDQPVERAEGDYNVKQYVPRTEGLFAKIEKWEHMPSQRSHWKVTTKENITSIYGQSLESKTTDPEDSTKVYQWHLEYTYDEKGNITRYKYKRENNINIDVLRVSEKNRLDNTGVFTKLYPKQIQYSSDRPFTSNDPNFFEEVKWHFHLVFDYGEHINDNITEDENWKVRQDPFSDYRSGFEQRTYRLCQRILHFHEFDELGSAALLVKSTEIHYNENPTLTTVNSIQHKSYEGVKVSSYPPITLQYQEPVIDPRIHTYNKEDLENLPVGVDGQQYQWADLYNEGLQGILTETTNAWYYKRNLGDENYYTDNGAGEQKLPQAKLGTQHEVISKPSVASITASAQLTDLDGNGTTDVVIRDSNLSGFHTQSKDGSWQNFQPFKKNLNINWNDPNLKILDVDGDGFPDVLITEDRCFTYYRSLGKEGHEAARKTQRFFDEEQGPNIVFNDPEQTIYLADMSGDGLSDIVRIQNGSICYWPNKGHAHFGAKVTMDNSPYFDHKDIFNQSRIRLGDIDGTGTTDIIYIAAQEIRYYPNQSGNRFDDPVIINQTLPTHSLATITTQDLLGNGTQCLVWSSPLSVETPPSIKYIDLMSGQKPYLITEINNNMGSITRMKYAPSTKYYLRDQKEGNPWITKLPFPVQVLEQVELYDQINQNRFVTKYAYHHGYFDGEEREFRGFGMVEQWDTETITDYINSGLFPAGHNEEDEVIRVAPIHTKTWFHTGFYPNLGNDEYDGRKIIDLYRKEYWNEDTEAFALSQELISIPDGLDIPSGAVEQREASRSLKGSPLRQEIYSLDGSPQQSVPYTVTENNYSLSRIQKRGQKDRKDKDYGVYLVTPAQTLTYQYERNTSDPRVSHQITLTADNYGQVTKSAAIGYGRRNTGNHIQQETTLITLSETTLINEPNNPSFYRLGLPSETKNYQLHEPTIKGHTLQTRESILTDIEGLSPIPYDQTPNGTTQLRTLDHTRIRYYDENQTPNAPLPLGQVASHGLPYETYQQALTPGLKNNLLNETPNRVTPALLTAGQYRDLDNDDNYWIPSGRANFDAAHFYLQTTQIDPFGNESHIQYDSHHLLPTKTTDALGNETKATYNYRTLQPTQITDPNGNRQAFAYDTRGMVSKIAVMGKEADSDGDTLADPTTTFSYDLESWMNHQKPNWAHTSAREIHQDTNTKYQESYAYTNGLGQVILTKTQTAPDSTTPTQARWLGTGRTILDNKGNPVKQYESYFSDTKEYESDPEIVESGVTPIIHYDPLGRAILTELPDHTHTRVEFTPWEQKNYDQNDTVLERLPDHEGKDKASWYSQIQALPNTSENVPQKRAAQLAEAHADTPQVVHLDALGRPFITIDHNKKSDGSDDPITMTTELDIKGNPLKITDAKGREAFTYTYDMVNQPLKTTHHDNGTRYALANVLGNPLKSWDSRDQEFEFKYDELQRPTKTYLTTTGSTPSLISLTHYGESLDTPEDNNHRGQAYLTFDSSGMTKNTAFDFKGNPLITEQQLANTYQTTPDWISLDNKTLSQVQSEAASLLSTTVYEQSTSYDALNRPVSMTKPDNTQVIPTYDEGGQLKTLSTKLQGAATAIPFVDKITYNARNQRKNISYSNGAYTTYYYDKDTFRLTRLVTTKSTGSNPLQDLNYTYDPVGNIVEQIDNTQSDIFYDNTQVSANGQYEYDALYRLLKAKGRELIGLNTSHNNQDALFSELTNGAHSNNSQAMERYTQTYQYDELGNIKEMHHSATAGTWTKHYHYAANNYLLSTSSDNNPPTVDDYTYDAHGNMTQMPHLASITWDYADRMQSAQLTAGANPQMAYYTYDAGGNRVRKVIVKGNIVEERIYIGDWEVYRKTTNGTVDTERETLHISDDTGRIALIDTETVGGTSQNIRYQFSNHLGSAALELDENANIISYEEYHPFGTTSYRAGRNETETSLKRYRYVGKERDEET
ncbi:SpvB/TcaC N-terminal domain-containing protein, partial [Reichenbachiella versicolor]|uniref:SpvB/TcaC N-terminal domain-containing protein n=1 Tax=Reichenbachiella versicolor TaxID=1821036 RepID=UPI000D6E9B62